MTVTRVLLLLTSVMLGILSSYLYDPYQFQPLLEKLPSGALRVLQGGQTDESRVEITAFIGRNNVTTLECWTVDTLSVEGMNIHQLGDISAGTHLSFPKGKAFDGGTRNAPALQFVIILQGSAFLTFPKPGSEAGYVPETLRLTPNHVYVGGDTKDVSELGHHTLVAGGSRILQLPIKGGVEAFAGRKRVVRDGACY